MVAGQAEQLLLETLLTRIASAACSRRVAPTHDSTHVLAAIRVLNRLELVGETLRHALNSLAVVAPDWLRAQARPLVERYAAPHGELPFCPRQPRRVRRWPTAIAPMAVASTGGGGSCGPVVVA